MDYLRVKEQVFIRNTSKGDFLLLGSTTFKVDEAAQAILELCDGMHTYEDVVNILAEHFDESRKEVEKALSLFVETVEDFVDSPSLTFLDVEDYILPIISYHVKEKGGVNHVN